MLILSAPDETDPLLRAQREGLTSARTGASERELVTVEAVGRGPKAKALRRRLGLPHHAFRVVLIGRDGGAKLISEQPIASLALFASIDAMPMRREEMRR